MTRADLPIAPNRPALLRVQVCGHEAYYEAMQQKVSGDEIGDEWAIESAIEMFECGRCAA